MPNSKSAPTLDREVQQLLKAYSNHLGAMERHATEAEQIKARLTELLPPESPLLDLMNGEEKH